MRKVTLTKRLAAIAAMVTPGSCVADVGTDHGYIPAWLLQNGICPHVFASDIRKMPLQCAIDLAGKLGLSDRVTFYLCDGLNGYPAGEINTVIVAGMGGENIAGILEAAPWTRQKNLILQPMSRPEALRRWLFETGYQITAERLVCENGTIYPILSVCGGTAQAATEAEFYVGRQMHLSDDPLFPEHLTRWMHRLSRAANGLSQAADDGHRERLEQLRLAILQIEQMRRRLEDADSR